MRIGLYYSKPAEFCPCDPMVVGIAAQLASSIQSMESDLKVEHVGSTSVPACGGKGIIDLAVLYPHGLLARARDILDDLGFQRQGGPEPFPEERPMRVGVVEHEGHCYRIHAHVIALDSEEHHQLVWFRDTLRRDPTLRRSYEETKRAILAAGIHDPLEYCKAKGAFITETLQHRATAESGTATGAPLLRALPVPPDTLSAGEVLLRFEKIVPGEPARGLAPYYHFRIVVGEGMEVGHINFRVGDSEHVRISAGHIGFEILEAFRGNRYAFQACRAIAPFVASIYDAVIITCDPGNHASRRTIERLGANFIDEIPVSPHDPQYQRGSRYKRRYQWNPRTA